MNVYVNNLVEGHPLTETLTAGLTRAARLLLAEYNLERAEVGIILADNEYLRQLNRTYRGLDAPTDVLSFGLMEPEELDRAARAVPGDNSEAQPVLGDVYISLDKALEQARESGVHPHREIMLLAVHGILHLLGYDHTDSAGRAAMELKESEFLGRLT